MIKRGGAAILISAACLAAECRAASTCAATIAELKSLLADPELALEWRETTMDDGRPLVLSILEREGALFLSFSKTGEGLWAEGAGIVCRAGSIVEARLAPERLKVGPAASWALRVAFAGGAQLTLARLGPASMRVETAGWSGVFACRRAGVEAAASRIDP